MRRETKWPDIQRFRQRKKCESGETAPNQELKGEVRWGVREVTEGAENEKTLGRVWREEHRGGGAGGGESRGPECERSEVVPMVW